MQSALEYPEPVLNYLRAEVEAGQVIGPLEPAQFPSVQVSSFGVIMIIGNSFCACPDPCSLAAAL
jgi:hypothetical protein